MNGLLGGDMPYWYQMGLLDDERNRQKLAQEMTHWRPQEANPATPVAQRLQAHLASIPDYMRGGLQNAVTGAQQYVQAAGRGETGQLPQGVIDAALNFAPIGMFAGVGAKTADVAKFTIAKQMAEKGASRDEIWANTGWFKGVDGKWRFEIPDDAARFGDRRGSVDSLIAGQQIDPLTEVRVGHAISHPELSAAYNIGDIPLNFRNKSGGEYVMGGGIDRENISLGATNKSTLLHELQHAIQQREGFARGGSPSELINPSSDMVTEAIRRSEAQGVNWAKLKPNHRWKVFNDIAFENYQKLAGEAEARLVQKRMDMTPAERAARPPWVDYDVPEAEQIIRFK